MTKFERAKRQTIRRWETLLDRKHGTRQRKYLYCGFCIKYMNHDLENICQNCPIFLLEGKSCGKVNFTYNNPMAVLIYVHQLTDPAR